MVVSHYIDDEKIGKGLSVKYETILNLLAPSTLVLIEYLSCLAFAFFFVFLLNFHFKRRSLNSFRLSCAFMFNLFSNHEPFFKRASSISLVYMWTLLFLFLMKTILTNNENMNKIIVDTSELIDSEEKIFQTKKGGSLSLTYVKYLT